jgi:hypothetical protein
MYYKWIASRFIAHAGREREREREERKKKRTGGRSVAGVAELTDSNSSRLMSALLNLVPLPNTIVHSFLYHLLISIVFIILITYQLFTSQFRSGTNFFKDQVPVPTFREMRFNEN